MRKSTRKSTKVTLPSGVVGTIRAIKGTDLDSDASILRACWSPEGSQAIDSDDLAYIMAYTRIATCGPTYSYLHVCKRCGISAGRVLDLRDLIHADQTTECAKCGVGEVVTIASIPRSSWCMRAVDARNFVEQA